MDRREIFNLGPAVRQALDALVEARWNPAGVPDALRPRAERILEVLRVMDLLGEDDAPKLKSPAEMLEALATQAPKMVEPQELSGKDAAALDALVEARFNPQEAPRKVRQRAYRVQETLSLLDHLTEESPGDLLVARTMQTVERARSQSRLEQQISILADSGPDATRGIAFRLRDAAAIAAMVIVSVSLLWSLLVGARASARQLACQNNLRLAGIGLAYYATDNDDAMPVTKARLGDPWWLTNKFDEEGNAQSNSAHLHLLVNGAYVRIADLTCPENAFARTEEVAGARDWQAPREVSFSYQNQYFVERQRMIEGPLIAVLADKSPFFEPGRYLGHLNRMTNSSHHAGGQNVLLANGRVAWLEKPVLHGRDNIFHVGDQGFDYYTGSEGPSSERDSFLVP